MTTLFWVLICIFILIGLYLLRLFLRGTPCLLHQRLDGKVVVVTGCNTGIGFETVAELARRGARVIMACRDPVRGARARLEILSRYGVSVKHSTKKNVARNYLESVLTRISPDQLSFGLLDLSCFQSIEDFASDLLKREPRIDILINNAGIQTSHDEEQTKHGLETQMGINYLGHFLLTQKLLPALKASGSARIINISSHSHYWAKLNLNDLNKPGSGSAYGRSKLANVIHAIELSKRYKDDGIVAVSLHPGLVYTELLRHSTILRTLLKLFLQYLIKTPWHGAQTTLFCALSPKLVPGGYYAECSLCSPNKQALNDTVRERVWDLSLKLVKASYDSQNVSL